MKLIVIHKKTDSSLNNNRAHFAKRPQNGNLDRNLLQFAVCSEPFADITFSCLSGDVGVSKGHSAIRGDSWHRSSKIVIEIPSTVQDGIDLAFESIDGYYREFTIPESVTNLVIQISPISNNKDAWVFNFCIRDFLYPSEFKSCKSHSKWFSTTLSMPNDTFLYTTF